MGRINRTPPCLVPCPLYTPARRSAPLSVGVAPETRICKGSSGVQRRSDRLLSSLRARHEQDASRDSPAAGRLRRLPEDGRAVGPSAGLSLVRPRRLLRFVSEPTRDRALQANASSGGRLRGG